mgnify:CR=1 FL=1
MMAKELRFLHVEEVIAINVAMIQKYSPDEQIGVKDYGLLESAVYRPKHTVFGENAYPTIFVKAASLFESLGQNHPFQNANKRTAFTSLLMFLKVNELHFKMKPHEASDFTVNMVNHKYGFVELAEIIKSHTK